MLDKPHEHYIASTYTCTCTRRQAVQKASQQTIITKLHPNQSSKSTYPRAPYISASELYYCAAWTMMTFTYTYEASHAHEQKAHA